ncbi:MAG: hypothetical protein ACRDYU_04840 [Actinomycetes bacterium]
MVEASVSARSHREVSVPGSPSAPEPPLRWRCRRCGNLTRFDVTRTARVREYVHCDLAGDAHVEESDVLTETVEEVRCRWCGGRDTVTLVPRPDAVAIPADAGETSRDEWPSGGRRA